MFGARAGLGESDSTLGSTATLAELSSLTSGFVSGGFPIPVLEEGTY